jgi:hypothetical protein
VTLLLTCVTDRFVVQASDRLLTFTNGSVADERAKQGNYARQSCNICIYRPEPVQYR